MIMNNQNPLFRSESAAIIGFSIIFSCAGISSAGKKADSPDSFYSKHKAEALEMARKKYVHTPVFRNACDPCHSSPGDASKLKGEVNALCFSCHPARQKDLKKKKVHEPFSGMPCTTCHSPHSSDNEFVLVSPVKTLCLTCHDVSAENVRKGHGGIIVRETDCTACHAPHGSDKDKLLLEAKVHPSFEPGGCDTCHDRPGPEGAVKLKGFGAEICLTCHEDKKEEQKKKNVHPPFLSGACGKCHSPHVSRLRAFMPSSTEIICRKCHDSIQDNGHPVVGHKSYSKGKQNPLDKSKPFDCASCHNSHSSDFRKLLVRETGEFCMACHEQ